MSTPTATPTTYSPSGFELHRRRGPFNAAFFAAMGPALERSMGPRKDRIFERMSTTIVELGSGVGANLGYLPEGATLVAIEPNRYMHPRLIAAASEHGVELDLRERMAEDTGLEDSSVDTVVSSLVLCSVDDPAAVLAEVRRILRPGGTYRFAEHVVAPRRSFTRFVQRITRRPWAWTFEGCSCERDLEHDIREAGFVSVTVERYRLSSPFPQFNTHIAGIARA